MSDDERAKSAAEMLKWEYGEVSQNFRTLAEIRFKLLALIPPLGGVAIYLLGRLAEDPKPEVQWLLAFISLLGFIATLGITFYDQRNSELYDALIGRAKFLERELKLVANQEAKGSAGAFRGQFLERPPRGKQLFGRIELGHDTGLALIYGTVLGAWLFPFTVSLLAGLSYQHSSRFAIGLVVATVAVIIFIRALARLDPARGRSRSSNDREENKSEGEKGGG